MKKTITMTTALIMVLLTATAFSVQQNEPDKDGKKARIKMIKNVNGIVSEIDTLLADFAPGDIEKIADTFVYTFSENGDKDSLSKKVMVYIDDKGDKKHLCKVITGDSLTITDLDISSVCKGDSLIKKIIITAGTDEKDMDKKMMVWSGKPGSKNENVFHIFEDGEAPRVKMIRHKENKNTIRLDDPSIISFKKKDLSGNREKIEIIREKPAKNEEPETIK